MFEEYQLTDAEKNELEKLTKNIFAGELDQVEDLVKNCHNKYVFAKTHSAYIKDWEATKARMEDDLSIGKLPPGISTNLHSAIIAETSKIIDKKLEAVREAFQIMFGESIYNYLGKDGKTKFLGIF